LISHHTFNNKYLGRHYLSMADSRLSLLGLPQEILDMIFGLCLTAPRPILRRATVTAVVWRATCECETRGAGGTRCSHICISQIPKSQIDRSLHNYSVSSELAIALLHVNREVHETAARALYGGNTFSFNIGIRRKITPRDPRPGYYLYKIKNEHYEMIDNMSDLAPHYLQLIKRCELNVQVLTVSIDSARLSYRKAAESLKIVAGHLGQDHALRQLNINYDENHLSYRRPKRERGFFQNVLEPLATVYNILEVPVTGALDHDFAAKLKRAMQGDHAACVAAEVKYGTRKVRDTKSGRGKRQRYRLGKFYDSEYIWEEDTPLLARVALDAGASNA